MKLQTDKNGGKMKKIEVIYNYAKESYELSLKRRDNIRSRTNLVAAFGFSIISLLLTSVLSSFSANIFNENKCFIYFSTAFIVVFILFIVFFLLVYGVKTIEEIDPVDTIYKISDIQKTSPEYKTIFEEACIYYHDSNIENAHLVAEDYVAMHYVSTLYAHQANNIYNYSKSMNRYFKFMCIAMILTVVILIIMKGVM